MVMVEEGMAEVEEVQGAEVVVRMRQRSSK